MSRRYSGWCFWHSRPLALLNNDYPNATVQSLLAHYAADNRNQERQQQVEKKDGSCDSDGNGETVMIPPSSSSASSSHRRLRTCQWNINYLQYGSYRSNRRNEHEAAAELLKVLVHELDSDVLVLNEFGAATQEEEQEENSGIAALHKGLEQAGYSVHVSHGSFPTAIATRLQVQNVSRLSLDNWRNVIQVDVRCADGMIVRVYGVHLEDNDEWNGWYRKQEIEVLLRHIMEEETTESSKCDYCTMIVGDFNQQRERDYARDEWKSIVDNKQRRSSPTDDGVASRLEEAGFVCTYDRIIPTVDDNNNNAIITTNWKKTDPPPSTHWTGTIVDYTYYNNNNATGTLMNVNAIYVLPGHDFSDHRPVITDWTWPCCESVVPKDGKQNVA